MSLKACSDCGRQVSSKALRCPNCGRKDPTRAGEDQRNRLLVAPSMLPTVKGACRECGLEVRVGLASCPSCGVPDPTLRGAGRRWAGVAAVVLLVAMLVGTAWVLGLLRPPGADPSTVESGLTGKAHDRLQDRPGR
jgi:RNA polymerase subunit RPABC4/transcription elongation factor Spt4